MLGTLWVERSSRNRRQDSESACDGDRACDGDQGEMRSLSATRLSSFLLTGPSVQYFNPPSRDPSRTSRGRALVRLSGVRDLPRCSYAGCKTIVGPGRSQAMAGRPRFRPVLAKRGDHVGYALGGEIEGKTARADGDGGQGEMRLAPHPSPKPGERVGHRAKSWLRRKSVAPWRLRSLRAKR